MIEGQTHEKIETIDSTGMEILSEFLGAADDYVGTNSGGGETSPYRIGVLGDDFIISSQSLIAIKPQGKVVPDCQKQTSDS